MSLFTDATKPTTKEMVELVEEWLINKAQQYVQEEDEDDKEEYKNQGKKKGKEKGVFTGF